MAIVPAAAALYLCDGHVRHANDKIDLRGLFNAAQAGLGFPHVHGRFCLFAELVNGLGDLSFHFDVRHADTDRLIHITTPQRLHFPDRVTTVKLVMSFERLRFPDPGVYLFELFCDNTWVCDARLLVQD